MSTDAMFVLIVLGVPLALIGGALYETREKLVELQNFLLETQKACTDGFKAATETDRQLLLMIQRRQP